MLSFIIFQLELQPRFGYRIYSKQRPTLGKPAHFSYYNPAVFFVKRDEILNKLIKFKYEYDCEAEHA
jgi:hypothetical protein